MLVTDVSTGLGDERIEVVVAGKVIDDRLYIDFK